ncbi:[acyl-carrier-protein] S-malonyltransferase [Streptomyces aurantiacus]|uniref:acyltransferase domain-containing protein n=1 Tax=Streptomyces aurantiacus TaxID=47760 RepID=UPI00278DAF62|nr:acyltransferase domain-containing protein [Streptomyces aurantiacus]MDQ0772830.1 [acyl-carrier-protein] S-malonyltransferase [Streptomyces aurantiacus]
MSSGVAFLFPGQGSYLPGVFAGLGADADRISDRVAEIDAVAAEYQLKPVQPLLFSPDAPSLGQLLESDHERLDVAILATSVALAALLESRYGLTPDHVLGHSLGEFGALAVAGVFTPADAARAVCERHATLRKAPPPVGGMLAVGTDPARAEELIASAGAATTAVSAHNATKQSVVSGAGAELEKVRQAAREVGIRTSRLSVPGPFHTPQLAEASALYATTMRTVRMSAPRERFFYSHGLGRFLTAADDVVELMVADMTRPVRFHEAVYALHAEGVTTFVECGALDVLTRIVSTSLPSAVTAAPLRESTVTSDLSDRLRPVLHSADADAAAPITETAATATVADADILETVRAVCAEILEYPPEVITDDADFQADLGVDSLAMTELLERALRTYDLSDMFHVANAGNYDTVAELAALVTGLLRDGAAPASERR